jgi:uncharacterized cupin superfamily protein
MVASPATVELEAEAIPADWILSGTPVARSKTLARSKDWTAHIVVWDCTAGTFYWHYSYDEVIIVVSGEAFLVGEGGKERRFGPGDIGFFPSGTTAKWRVGDHIRKIAVLRETMWRPLGLGLKAWNKLLRSIGLTGRFSAPTSGAVTDLRSPQRTTP